MRSSLLIRGRIPGADRSVERACKFADGFANRSRAVRAAQSAWHHDRPPRSSVDWRQAKTGNARRAGSQETRELEMSQGWMCLAWRVPRWSAGRRRARRDKARCRARCIGGRHVCRCCAAPNEFAPSGAPLSACYEAANRESAKLGRRSVAGTKAIAGTKMPEQNRLKFVQRVRWFCRATSNPISSLCNHTLPIRRWLNIRRGITSKTGFDGIAANRHAAAIWRGCDL